MVSIAAEYKISCLILCNTFNFIFVYVDCKSARVSICKYVFCFFFFCFFFNFFSFVCLFVFPKYSSVFVSFGLFYFLLLLFGCCPAPVDISGKCLYWCCKCDFVTQSSFSSIIAHLVLFHIFIHPLGENSIYWVPAAWSTPAGPLYG